MSACLELGCDVRDAEGLGPVIGADEQDPHVRRTVGQEPEPGQIAPRGVHRSARRCVGAGIPVRGTPRDGVLVAFARHDDRGGEGEDGADEELGLGSHDRERGVRGVPGDHAHRARGRAAEKPPRSPERSERARTSHAKARRHRHHGCLPPRCRGDRRPLRRRRAGAVHDCGDRRDLERSASSTTSARWRPGGASASSSSRRPWSSA